MSATLHLGDCIDVMRTMADNSVDAIVTDPPYHLTSGKKGGSGEASLHPAGSPFGRAAQMNLGGERGFMGMKWDGGDIAQSVELWTEALRVLKPGGHLLAFAGSRTYHRMVCAIEDAGFEVRDQIMYLYGSGFPKSMNLDRLRGQKVCGCQPQHVDEKAEKKTECHLHPVRGTDVSTPLDSGEGRGEILQPSLPKSRASSYWQAQCAGVDEGREQSRLEGRGDVPAPAWELRSSEVCPGTGMGAADGTQGWLPDGASPRDGGMVRVSADQGRVRSSPEPLPTGKPAKQSGTVARQSQPQTRRAWPICGGCGLPVVPKGLGTALKPAHEPICVARKPLIGTPVVANVLAHGTGALNIDACRVPVSDDAYTRNCSGDRGHDQNRTRAMEFGMTAGSADPLGRWPANVVHDGSDEVVAGFPAQAGARAPVHTRNADKFRNSYGAFAGNIDEAGSTFQGDSGSAARFFYCAKASRRDRNEGCEGMEKKPLHWSSGDQNPGSFQAEGTDKSSQNNHPTVKPTSLMQWLVRLVTPPGGVVLDPFMGSGSTGKACVREGFGFIGIELSPDYLVIAEARIAHEQARVEAASVPPQQPDLFKEPA
jgi:DNA modification methylase